MQNTLSIPSVVFFRVIKDFGSIEIRPISVENDMSIIHNWVTKPYATFWGMQHKSLEEIALEYTELLRLKHHDVFVGTFLGEPIFLMEKYKASKDRISNYYEAAEGDYGMHILVAPPTKKIAGFTWNVFSTVLEFFFSNPDVTRIVVEPDVRNYKIHLLNKKAGFAYYKEIELPEKRAVLSFCDFNTYLETKRKLVPIAIPKTTSSTSQPSIAHLKPIFWEKANKALVKKALSEFAHELILLPKKLRTVKKRTTYFLRSDTSEIQYEFIAKKTALDHWEIDEKSIKNYTKGEEAKIDALQFIIAFRHTLGINDECLPVYLEEISSTLASAAYKIKNQTLTATELLNASFQEIEHAMSEGHPCFVANNGRIGFSGEDYIKYAPESNQPFKIYWLAGHKSKATYAAIKGYEYNTVMHSELGIATIVRFNSKLKNLGLLIEDYFFIPVHPWQWNHKIIQVFAADIASQNLVFLGESSDEYTAQQSIRTLHNKNHPSKMYTKTALSILNMGFMRGLSPYYMKSTPAITTWITELLKKDAHLTNVGFEMLGEVATVGFENTNYEVLGKTNAHNKMLSALWRESPHNKINPGQTVMTMAAFLHVDTEGNSFLSSLINASPVDTSSWLCQYLKAYLNPLLHCFYKYELVFIPHGENLIMVMENHIPARVLMKDITEEVIVFDPAMQLPGDVQRLYAETSDTMKVLTLFTDVFDSFFRFMGAILEKHLGYSASNFWELVADCVHAYQAEHPELRANFNRYDLFVPEFDRCCLNRLQLKNTKQMLNLADPIESLILQGTLQNPIAKFKHKNRKTKKKEIQNI